MREFWDFDENINYITIQKNNYYYKVLEKYNDNSICAELLYNITIFINKISKYIDKNYNNIINNSKNPLIKKYLDCFLLIHPNNYLLSEMQLNTIFNGLNKPKELYICNSELGPDKNLRAAYRHIFLSLRKNNGEFKNINNITNLVIHEITHTMCNHVTWRDDNHYDDFKYCENLLKNIIKNNKLKIIN